MAETKAVQKPRSFIASLDGYRTLGTLIVVMHHVPFVFFRTPFGYGWWVLQSFFVLSGFLLTMIQLKEKDKGYPLARFMKEYYLKRFYRIFPLYWTFLAVLSIIILAFGVTQIPLVSGLLEEYRDNWFLFWSYTYNYKEIVNFAQDLQPNFNPFLSHLWSLSVEEQFYLVLPLLVFFLNRESLKKVVLGIIILSPLIRLGTYLYFNHVAYLPENSAYFNDNDYMKDSWTAVIILRTTWCQMDCFAFGMALALWDFSWIKSAKKWFWWAFLGFVVLVTANGIVMAYQLETETLLAFSEQNPILRRTLEIFPIWFVKFYTSVSEHLILISNYHFVYIYTLVNFLSFLIVLSCMRNRPFLSFLSNDKMIETGKFTYGAYIFHYPLMMLITIFSIPFIVKLNKISTKGFTMIFGDYMGVLGSQLVAEIATAAIYLPLLWLISKWSYEYFEMIFIRLRYKMK